MQQHSARKFCGKFGNEYGSRRYLLLCPIAHLKEVPQHMSLIHSLQRSIALSLCVALALPSVAAQKKTAETEKPSYEQPQPERENLDLSMYDLIRQEGLAHSHVMEYASALTD